MTPREVAGWAVAAILVCIAIILVFEALARI